MNNYYYILGQIFGLLAAIITIIAFSYTNKDKTVRLLLLSSLFGALQFAFLGAFSGAFISIFSFIRTLLAKKKSNDNKIIWLLYFIITIIGIYTYDGYISLIPTVATYIGTYALFYLKDINFRVALVIPTFLWLIYNYYIGSIGGTIRELIILVLHIKVIVLSIGFAYRKEIYTLNYDIFVYLYNNSTSKAYILWKNFQHYLHHVLHPFSEKKKGISSKLSSN